MSASDLPVDPDALPLPGRDAPPVRLKAPADTVTERVLPAEDAQARSDALPANAPPSRDAALDAQGQSPAVAAESVDAAAGTPLMRPQMTQFLDFERPIAELEAQIHELRRMSGDSTVDLDEEVAQLIDKSDELTREVYGKLSAWQVSQVARHPLRPYALDYIGSMCETFEELHGDRAFADDPAIVGGIARIGSRSLVIMGHQKGRTTNEKVRRRFGMPRPEGYRKAARLMRLAERFKLPLVTLIDTPGAYPGVGAEERGQSEAIAANIQLMASLRVPIVCVVIGEGGSGGALALGVGDRLLMLRHSTYSVISPEGCASILWKSAEKAADAAEAMGITTDRLAALDIIDEVVEEPLGGAHRDPTEAAESVRTRIETALDSLEGIPADDLLANRYRRLMSYGKFKDGAG